MVHKKKIDRAVRLAMVTFIPLVAGLGLDGPRVWAQTATNAEDSGKADTLQEITVTANHRAENNQNVPLAVTAITGLTAAEQGITDAQALASEIPGLTFNRQADSSIPFLRGIGSSVGGVGVEPSVALYVDDVYIPDGSASLSNFTNIESMEVAKGPQGTLFGRNAVGGVIQVYTRDPSSTPSIDVTAGYANYDTVSSSLYVTGPLTSTLSANLSLYQANQNDGWGRNVLTGSQTYTGWDNGGRAKLLWTPTDKISVMLTYDFDATRTEEGIDFRQSGASEAIPNIPATPGFYNSDTADGKSRLRQQGTSIKISADLDWAKFVSITAWRYTTALQDYAYDPVPISLAYVGVVEQEHTWTQELRLLSPDDSKVKWIVGAFYYHDNSAFDPLQFTGLAFAPFPSLDAYGFEKTESWAGFGQATYQLLADTNLTAGVRFTQDRRSLVAGAIYGDGPAYGLPAGFVPAANSPQSATWSKFTYRLTLDHHFTDNVMGYVGYNTGFKSGLFNPVVSPGSPIAPAVQPESLGAYTLGEKSEFFEHRLRVNAEAFYYKDKNIQVDVVQGDATFITNAAAATMKGIDLEVTVLPLPPLTITGSIEAIDSKYDSFPNGQYYVYNAVGGGNCAFSAVPAPGPVPCGGVSLPPGYNAKTGNWNLGGNKTIETPPFSSSLTADYQIPSRVGKFDMSIGWTHTGDYYADVDNGKGQVAPSSPQNDKQGIINLLNSSIGWISSDSHWTARLWGKNLTGQQYWSYAAEDAFTTFASAAPPRTYGLTVGAHW